MTPMDPRNDASYARSTIALYIYTELDAESDQQSTIIVDC